MKDDNIKYWFSLDNGVHIPVKEGESKREAVSKAINKKISRVEKNKNKYDTIQEFKKKKKSYNLAETKPKKKEVTDQEQRDNYREDDKAKEITSKIRSEQQSGVQRFMINDNEFEKELKSRVNDGATEEDVKQMISDFKKKKMSNKRLTADKVGDNELANITKEIYDTQQEVDDLRSFSIYTTDDKYGAHWKHNENLSSSEKNRLDTQQERIYELERQREKLLSSGTTRPISNNSVEGDIISNFKTTNNLVSELNKQRRGNEDIYKTAERYVQSGNYAQNYNEAREYLSKKFDKKYNDVSYSNKRIWNTYVQMMTIAMNKMYNRYKGK